MRPSRIAVAVVVLATAVSGCSTLTGKKAPPCPGAMIARSLSHVTVFRPGKGHDITDINYEARLPHISAACTYDDKGAVVQTGLTIVAARGPANTTRRAKVSYFIAVLDPKNKILAKKVFTSNLRFPPNQDRGATTDELVQRIPVGKGKSAAGYTVVAGFQLTAAQLAYNRRNPGTSLLGPVPPPRQSPLIGTDGVDNRPLYEQADRPYNN